MIVGDKEILIVGDRVLIRIEQQEERTQVGLYLPPTALEKENVHSGTVAEVGPGIPLPPRIEDEDVPWDDEAVEQMRYIPLQAQKGDHALFLRKEAVEVTFEGDKYVVVPHAAILALVRSSGLMDVDQVLDGGDDD